MEALRTIFPAYDLDFSQSLSFDCLLVASQLALLDISDLSIFMKSDSLSGAANKKAFAQLNQ